VAVSVTLLLAGKPSEHVPPGELKMMFSHAIAVIGIGSIRPGGAWEHVVHGQAMAVLVTLPVAVPSKETERTCAGALTITAPDSTTATHSPEDVQDTPLTNRDPMPPSTQAL
jgi:hypothetical protein